MCHHYRLVYGCNHHAWLAKARSCVIEKRFEAGLSDEGCSVMVSHPLKTTRICRGCPDCEKKKASTDAKIEKIKSLLKTLQVGISRSKTSIEWRTGPVEETPLSDSTVSSGTPTGDIEEVATLGTDEVLSPIGHDEIGEMVVVST